MVARAECHPEPPRPALRHVWRHHDEPVRRAPCKVPSIWATLLHYGAISEAGEVPVGLVFDHRIMDGAVVGYTLMEMEQILHQEIVAELRDMCTAKAA